MKNKENKIVNKWKKRESKIKSYLTTRCIDTMKNNLKQSGGCIDFHKCHNT